MGSLLELEAIQRLEGHFGVLNVRKGWRAGRTRPGTLPDTGRVVYASTSAPTPRTRNGKVPIRRNPQEVQEMAFLDPMHSPRAPCELLAAPRPSLRAPDRVTISQMRPGVTNPASSETTRRSVDLTNSRERDTRSSYPTQHPVPARRSALSRPSAFALSL